MASYKNQNTDLDLAIARLEFDRAIKLEELKNQASVTFESIKPLNIIKETFSDFSHSPETKSNVLQTVASIAGGYLSKKIIIGKPNSIFTKILGYVFQYGMTKFISKKVEQTT